MPHVMGFCDDPGHFLLKPVNYQLITRISAVGAEALFPFPKHRVEASPHFTDLVSVFKHTGNPLPPPILPENEMKLIYVHFLHFPSCLTATGSCCLGWFSPISSQRCAKDTIII